VSDNLIVIAALLHSSIVPMMVPSGHLPLVRCSYPTCGFRNVHALRSGVASWSDSQLLQSAEEVRPTCSLYLPDAHSLQPEELCPAKLLNLPASQVLQLL